MAPTTQRWNNESTKFPLHPFFRERWFIDSCICTRFSSLLSGMSVESISMTCTICTYPQYMLMHVFAYYSKWNKTVGLEMWLGWYRYMHNSTPSLILTMDLKTVALSWLVLYIQGILARWIHEGHSPPPKLPSLAFLCECAVHDTLHIHTLNVMSTLCVSKSGWGLLRLPPLRWGSVHMYVHTCRWIL